MKKGNQFHHDLIYRNTANPNIRNTVSMRKVEGNQQFVTGIEYDANGRELRKFTRVFTKVEDSPTASVK
jgi:hypothetical protein